jgi:hypothetical protein
VKPGTIDQHDQNRQANGQKQPWPLSDVQKFDKGTRITDKGQHPKR